MNSNVIYQKYFSWNFCRMAGFDLQLDNDGTYSVATFFYFCVQIGIGLVVLFRYMVMRPVDMKKILFVFLIIGSFVIARRYSGADALLETRLLIAGQMILIIEKF